MFTKTVITEQTLFIDKHGDSIGHIALNIIEKDDGNFYGVIEADMPKYSEYTVWSDTTEARYYFDKDVDEAIEKYKNI